MNISKTGTQNGKTGTDKGKTGTHISKTVTHSGKTGIHFTASLYKPRKMGKREFNLPSLLPVSLFLETYPVKRYLSLTRTTFS